MYVVTTTALLYPAILSKGKISISYPVLRELIWCTFFLTLPSEKWYPVWIVWELTGCPKQCSKTTQGLRTWQCCWEIQWITRLGFSHPGFHSSVLTVMSSWCKGRLVTLFRSVRVHLVPCYVDYVHIKTIELRFLGRLVNCHGNTKGGLGGEAFLVSKDNRGGGERRGKVEVSRGLGSGCLESPRVRGVVAGVV